MVSELFDFRYLYRNQSVPDSATALPEHFIHPVDRRVVALRER